LQVAIALISLIATACGGGVVVQAASGPSWEHLGWVEYSDYIPEERSGLFVDLLSIEDAFDTQIAAGADGVDFDSSVVLVQVNNANNSCAPGFFNEIQQSETGLVLVRTPPPDAECLDVIRGGLSLFAIDLSVLPVPVDQVTVQVQSSEK